MNMRLRKLVAAGAVCILASGCVAIQPKPNPLPGEQPIQVRYWAEAPSQTETEIIAAFQQKHPGITVSRVGKAWPKSADRWPFQPGEVDVLFLRPQAVGPLVQQGVLSELPGNLLETAEQELRNSLLLQGKHYDLPLTINPLVVFTWPDLISRPDLRWSWGDLITMAEDAAQKRTPAGAQFHGLAVHPSATMLVRAIVVQGAVLEGVIPMPEVLYLNMNPASVAPGVALVHKLFHGKAKGYSPPHETPDAALKLFAERKAAMLLTDYDTGAAFLKGIEGWTVHVTPKLGSMHVPVAEVTSVAMAADSKRPEQALQLAAFLASEEAARQRVQHGLLPAFHALQPDWLSYAGHLVSYPRAPDPEESAFATALDQTAEMLTRPDADPAVVMERLTALQKQLCTRLSRPERPVNCRP